MRSYLIFIIALLMLSCSPNPKGTEVHHIGVLREIMHQGQFQSRLKLDTLISEHLFGLGAMDSLSGEVLVLDNEIYTSKVVDSTVQVFHNEKTDATLFVYAEINEWDTLTITGVGDIEKLLKEIVSTQDVEAPFPFMLIGTPANLAYHVINFDAENGDIKNHKSGAFTGELTNESSTILGFYATDAKGIYTHHDSNLHMHFINATLGNAGHIDDVDFTNREFKLLIPKS